MDFILYSLFLYIQDRKKDSSLGHCSQDCGLK